MIIPHHGNNQLVISRIYQNDENGNQLKNIIIDKGLVQQAVQYLELYTPSQAFRYDQLIHKAWLTDVVSVLLLCDITLTIMIFSDSVYFFFLQHIELE
jgi:uncharacterized membrane protein YwzB